MAVNHHNHEYYTDPNSNNVPIATGDRYYGQDLARDFWHQLDAANRPIWSLFGGGSGGGVLWDGGQVSQGTGDNLDITAASGYVGHDVEVPDDISSLPGTSKIEEIIAWVQSEAQTDLSISSATLDGVTTNYVKLQYTETDGTTRQRAKQSGSYAYERVPSYQFVVDSSAPTSKDIMLATFVGSSGGAFTFSNQALPRVTTFSRTLLDDPDASAARATLEMTELQQALNRAVPNAWAEDEKLVASDGAATDYFGVSVAINGNYAIVGAQYADIGGNGNQGAAYIFHRSDGVWDSGTKIVASDGAAGDLFGCSVAISGDYAIVGARQAEIGGNTSQGAAYIFHRTGTNSWDSGTKIVASDGAASDLFGVSVSISGDYAVVGARTADVGGNSNQGAAYVFNRTGTNTWDSGTKIVASDGATGDEFGTSVGIDGDYAIVGAPTKDDGGNVNEGAAYVFHRTGTNTWDSGTKLFIPDGAADDNIGDSVGISGDYAVVGAPGADISGTTNQGKLGVCYRTGTNSWSTGVLLTASDGRSDDRLGASVSISGNYIIAGAFGRDFGTNATQGSAYIFYRTGIVTWDTGTEIVASDGANLDEFGRSVAIDGDYAIVGARLADIGGNSDQGAAYISDRPLATLWT